MATWRPRRGWINFDPPNLLTTVLGGTPQPAPFAQTDWPNPRVASQPTENRSFTRSANVQLIGQDKFFGAAGQAPYQTDWPNPLVARQPQENRGFVRAANVWLIGQDRFFGAAGQAPVYDWPNPQRARPIPQADSQGSLLVGPLAVPFNQTDWQNPYQPRQPLENRGFTRGACIWLIGKDFLPFRQADWPNPARPRPISQADWQIYSFTPPVPSTASIAAIASRSNQGISGSPA